jgi:hypothetical protein
MVKNKSKQKGAGNLRQVLGAPLRQALGAPLRQALGAPLRQALGAPLRQALGAPLRQALGAQLSQRMFTPATFTDMGRKSGFDLIEITQKKQPAIDLWKIPVIDVNDTGNPTTTTRDSILHDKIDISKILMRPTSVLTKVVIGKLIAAFLSVLIANSIGNTTTEIKHDTVNETTEAIYDYMIKTASERVQEGDTTIIASMYKTLGQYISPDVRKKMLQNLVIDGVSYGWLAEYDAIIDQWLNKIIEIKGGNLPSDKYIFDLVNIIQNKVLPVSNQIWKLTNTDPMPDSYWNTSEGLMTTAIGLRQMLAEDTLISKIVIGILSATEVVIDARSIENIFGDINTMLKTLIIKIKSDIAKGSANLKPLHHQTVDIPLSKTFIPNGDNIKKNISELKQLDQYLDKTKTNIQKIKIIQPRQTTNWPTNIIKAPTEERRVAEIQHLGAFDLFKGGDRKSRRRHRRSKQKNIKYINFQ